jgi:VWFA-related protein
MLVLDTSGSVIGEKLDHLRVAAHAFIEGLEDKDEAGLLSFSDELHLRKEVGSDLESVHRALEQPMKGGATGFNDALYAGLILAEARGGRPLVLVFTDGLDNSSWLTSSELTHVVQESEAVVFLVGVRSTEGWTASSRWNSEARARGFLHGLARTTGGKIWYADSAANLRETFLNVLVEVKSRYLLSFQPRGVEEEGWHDLNVRLKSDKADEIRFRPGYQSSSNP